MKLIDKDAVLAIIEKFIYGANIEADIASTGECFDEKVADAKYQLCKCIKGKIDTLEVKEEILDESGKTKLMQKCVHKAYKRGYDMGVRQTINKMIHNTKEVDLEQEATEFVQTKEFVESKESPILLIAEHFFELGLKAQKGE